MVQAPRGEHRAVQPCSHKPPLAGRRGTASRLPTRRGRGVAGSWSGARAAVLPRGGRWGEQRRPTGEQRWHGRPPAQPLQLPWCPTVDHRRTMASFEKDANVWYHHPVETWIPTTVLEGGSGEITVKTEDGEVRQHRVCSSLLGANRDAMLHRNSRLTRSLAMSCRCIRPASRQYPIWSALGT